MRQLRCILIPVPGTTSQSTFFVSMIKGQLKTSTNPKEAWSSSQTEAEAVCRVLTDKYGLMDLHIAPYGMWKLDESLTCPQCEHHNALLFLGGKQYQCRDCGYLYNTTAPLCHGCGNPITKRCDLDCYEIVG